VSLLAQQVCTQEQSVDPDVIVAKIDVTAFMQQGANREDVVAAKKERNRAIEKKEECANYSFCILTLWLIVLYHMLL